MTMWRARERITDILQLTPELITTPHDRVSRIAAKIVFDLYDNSLLRQYTEKLTRWQHLLIALGIRK